MDAWCLVRGWHVGIAQMISPSCHQTTAAILTALTIDLWRLFRASQKVTSTLSVAPSLHKNPGHVRCSFPVCRDKYQTDQAQHRPHCYRRARKPCPHPRGCKLQDIFHIFQRHEKQQSRATGLRKAYTHETKASSVSRLPAEL